MAGEWVSKEEAERQAHAAFLAGRDQMVEEIDKLSDWHLDKKVPIALIVAFVTQTIVLVYVGTTWKSDVDHRIDALEKSDEARRPQESRIIVVEQQVKFIAESMSRIETKIDALGKPGP